MRQNVSRIVRERLVALLSAPVEEIQSFFCPGDVVFPVDIDSNMASADDILMLAYHFQKKNEYAEIKTFVTVPFTVIDGTKLSKRLCFICRVLAASARGKKRVRTDS
jgi:hypothetical protein